MTVERGVEAFVEEEPERDIERAHDRHRRRERCVELRLRLARPFPVERVARRAGARCGVECRGRERGGHHIQKRVGLDVGRAEGQKALDEGLLSGTDQLQDFFHGAGAAATLGTPCGRQFAMGSCPDCDPSAR